MPTAETARRTLRNFCGEFASVRGPDGKFRWIPAKTAKKLYRLETVDEETGEQQLVEELERDAAGNVIYQDNPAAVHSIRTLFPTEKSVPIAPFPEPEGRDSKVAMLEAQLHELRMLITGNVPPAGPLLDASGAPVADGKPVEVEAVVSVPAETNKGGKPSRVQATGERPAGRFAQ